MQQLRWQGLAPSQLVWKFRSPLNSRLTPQIKSIKNLGLILMRTWVPRCAHVHFWKSPTQLKHCREYWDTSEWFSKARSRKRQTYSLVSLKITPEYITYTFCSQRLTSIAETCTLTSGALSPKTRVEPQLNLQMTMITFLWKRESWVGHCNLCMSSKYSVLFVQSFFIQAEMDPLNTDMRIPLHTLYIHGWQWWHLQRSFIAKAYRKKGKGKIAHKADWMVCRCYVNVLHKAQNNDAKTGFGNSITTGWSGLEWQCVAG